MKQINDTGKKGFVLWLRENQPALYKLVAARTGKGTLSGLGDDNPLDPGASTPAVVSPAPADSSWMDTVKNLVMGAGQVLLTKQQLDQQSRIMDIQLSRAQQGLPPLNIDPATYGLQPTIGVGLAPTTQKLVMYGLLGIGGLLLLNTLMKHR